MTSGPSSHRFNGLFGSHLIQHNYSFLEAFKKGGEPLSGKKVFKNLLYRYSVVLKIYSTWIWLLNFASCVRNLDSSPYHQVIPTRTKDNIRSIIDNGFKGNIRKDMKTFLSINCLKIRQERFKKDF